MKNIIKKIFSFGSKKSNQKLSEIKPPQKIVPGMTKKKIYLHECIIYYKDNPVRRVKFQNIGYTKKHALTDIENNLRLKVVKSYQKR